MPRGGANTAGDEKDDETEVETTHQKKITGLQNVARGTKGYLTTLYDNTWRQVDFVKSSKSAFALKQ